VRTMECRAPTSWKVVTSASLLGLWVAAPQPVRAAPKAAVVIEAAGSLHTAVSKIVAAHASPAGQGAFAAALKRAGVRPASLAVNPSSAELKAAQAAAHDVGADVIVAVRVEARRGGRATASVMVVAVESGEVLKKERVSLGRSKRRGRDAESLRGLDKVLAAALSSFEAPRSAPAEVPGSTPEAPRSAPEAARSTAEAPASTTEAPKSGAPAWGEVPAWAQGGGAAPGSADSSSSVPSSSAALLSPAAPASSETPAAASSTRADQLLAFRERRASRERALLRLGVGLSQLGRRFTIAGRTAQPLRPYSPGLGISCGALELQLYPLARMRDSGIWGNFGIELAYERAVAAKSKLTGSSTTVETNASAWSAGARLRFIFAPVELGLRLGYGAMDFSFKTSDATLAAELPSTSYKYARAGGDAAVRLGALLLAAGGDYLYVMDKGPLEKSYFPGAGIQGFAARLLAAYSFTGLLSAQLTARYQSLSYSATGSADSASDQLFSATLGAVLSL
jgi:hypothetical protein